MRAAGLPLMNTVLLPADTVPGWQVSQQCGNQPSPARCAGIPLMNTLVLALAPALGAKQSCPEQASPNLAAAAMWFP